ncbi:glycine betaine/L-proline ABC transporter ATP-binding protein [Hyphomicrobium sp. 2TAF46]
MTMSASIVSLNTSPAPEPSRRKIALEAKNLWKIFGATTREFSASNCSEMDAGAYAGRGWVPAVRDVSLEVAAGEVSVIMGLSGSGKSTLVRCLSRLIEPTSGSILFHGRDLLAMPEAELIDIRRKRMGMVFQNFALIPNRSVLGNVALPLEILGINRTAREARAREMISLVGLNGREDHGPGELSGGQQQRVGIARSLAVDPEIWFLDEPFSALDPLIRSDLQDELLRLQNTLAKTIIFITHDLDEAIKIADRITIMESGQVVQTASPEDLVTKPANSYVARFTSKVSLSKVVRARSLIDRSIGVPPHAVTIAADQTVEEFAPLLVSSDAPLVVVGNGTQFGLLDKRRALNVLAGIRPAT